MSSILSLIRLPNVCSAASNVVMGGWLVGAPAKHMALGALASMCLYAGGMALNDVVDLEKDRIAHPHRPLPSGVLSRSVGLWVAVWLGVAGVGVAFSVSSWVGVAACGVVAAVVVYDVLLKSWAVPGAMAMGLCRALNVAIGLSLATDSGWWTFAPVAACVGVFVAGLTLVSTLEDEPSSSAGTLGVTAMGAALVGAAWWILQRNASWMAWIPFLMVVAVVGTLSVQMMRNQLASGTVGTWVGRLVKQLISLDAALAAASGGWVAGLVVWSLMIPSMVLPKRVFSGGHS